MKAVVVAKNGVEILDVEIPIPKKNEVLIKVFSCGLNRADLMVADGGAHGSSGGSGTIWSPLAVALLDVSVLPARFQVLSLVLKFILLFCVMK